MSAPVEELIAAVVQRARGVVRTRGAIGDLSALVLALEELDGAAAGRAAPCGSYFGQCSCDRPEGHTGPHVIRADDRVMGAWWPNGIGIDPKDLPAP